MLCTILIMINEKKIVAFLLIKYLHVNKYNFLCERQPTPTPLKFSWFYRIPKSIRAENFRMKYPDIPSNNLSED